MKKLLVVKVQSLTDLITNSSSELFQLKTEQTVEQVSEILPTITSGYYDPILFNVAECRKTMKEVEEKKEILRKNKSLSLGEIVEERSKIESSYPNYRFYYYFVNPWFYDPEDAKNIRKIYENYLCACYNDRLRDELQAEFLLFVVKNKYANQDSRQLYPDEVNPIAFDEFIASHKLPPVTECTYPLYYGSIEDLDGCILLGSSSENSIPYETWDIINDTFNGTNYHLG